MSFYVAHPPGFTKKRAERSINIVLLGDGFFPHREAVFLMHVDSFARRLLRTAPFNRFQDYLTVSCIFRGAKVSLAHLKPGQECDWRNQRPNGQPPPDDYEFGTPYGALFCRTRNAAGEAERESLWGNKNKVWADVATEPSLVGLVCFPLVLVDNDQLSGGNKGGFTKPALPMGQLPDVGWLSIDPGWRLTAMHELGHSAFGLADEYDSGTGRYTGADPASPNITTVNTRQKLIDQWRATRHKGSLRVWHSLMKPSTPAPTAINPGCVSQGDQQPEIAVIGSGETGLYEGAHQWPCGVFRANHRCMMRNQNTRPEYCPVCEWTIEEKFAATINPLHAGQTVPLAPPAFGLWTHMWIHHEVKPDHQGNEKLRPLYGFYNQSGRYAVRPASNTAGGDLEAEVTAPGSVISNGAGWSTMLPCEIANDTCLIAHSISFQRLAIYRLMDAPGNLRVLTETFDSGVGGYPFTHAATFFSKGQLHLLGYHALTGAIDIAHVAKNSVRPVTVFGTLLDATRVWPTGFSNVTTMFVDNVPFVLRHNANGDVELESLDPPGAGPVPFARTGHWNPGATFVTAYVSAGRTYVCRSSIGQYRAFDRVWPGGRGIEALAREQRADLTFALAPIQYLPTGGPFEALVALNGGTELQFLNVKR